MKFDSLIIGGGLAGLVCGIRCAEAGLKTGIVSKGESGLAFASGTIDLLGHDVYGKPLENPFDGIEQLIRKQPEHPYARLGLSNIKSAMSWFQALSDAMEIPYSPLQKGENHQRLTALGALRPTYFAPASMTKLPVTQTARDLQRVAVINIKGFRDFQPDLAAENLQQEPDFADVEIISRTISLRPSILSNRDSNTMRSVELSRQLDNDQAIEVLGNKIKAEVGRVDLVLIPAVLSMDHGVERIQQLGELLGCDVCELATLPPSLPGIRLSNRLHRRFHRLGGLIMSGDQVQKGVINDSVVQSLNTHANTQIPLAADHVVLTSGSFMSSGLMADRQKIYEPVFGLDVNTELPRSQWANHHFLNGKPHAFASFGVVTNDELRPSQSGKTINNLYCAGSILGHAQPVEEGSAGGIAISTGWAVAEMIIEQSCAKQGVNDYVR